MDLREKIIAFYLPQFHPIPENNEWWGKGYTEWTNVGKAKPLFKNHYQPRVPADLGYYDLRIPKVREEQALMAKEAGIYGFCYWHYWFGNGKQLLEEPFNEVLNTGEPNFPFCLGWANESWEAKTWNANETAKNKILIEQSYYGEKDNELHFYSILKAFKDNRYIKIENRPLFLIYQPGNFKEIQAFISQWNNLARLNGLENGLHFVAHTPWFKDYNKLIEMGFNSITVNPMSRVINNLFNSKSAYLRLVEKVMRYILKIKILTIIDYKEALSHFTNMEEDSIENVIPTIIPNWDHSPRSGKNAWILHNSSPKLFEINVKNALECVKSKSIENKIIFLKSWNEWGEGNYMEPDLRYGTGYLKALRKVLLDQNRRTI
jgi:lipopolysaccharide biosynthesis protein